MIAKGTFDITMTGEPPYADDDGVTLARARFAKTFRGDLDGASTVEFLGARTPVTGSAGYVALERFAGTVAGRRGTFVAVHYGLMDHGAQQLTITLVPDAATGELRGLRGTMTIEIIGGVHHYTLVHEA